MCLESVEMVLQSGSANTLRTSLKRRWKRPTGVHPMHLNMKCTLLDTKARALGCITQFGVCHCAWIIVPNDCKRLKGILALKRGLA